jgi:hypothetical protein
MPSDSWLDPVLVGDYESVVIFVKKCVAKIKIEKHEPNLYSFLGHFSPLVEK